MAAIHEIFVTNKNDFLHEDRYAGDDYCFPPGEKVLIPIDAARHMFGFQNPDKTDALVRLGWTTKLDPVRGRFVPDEDGPRKLARFVFTAGKMVEINVPADMPPEPEDVSDEVLQIV